MNPLNGLFGNVLKPPQRLSTLESDPMHEWYKMGLSMLPGGSAVYVGDLMEPENVLIDRGGGSKFGLQPPVRFDETTDRGVPVSLSEQDLIKAEMALEGVPVLGSIPLAAIGKAMAVPAAMGGAAWSAGKLKASEYADTWLEALESLGGAGAVADNPLSTVSSVKNPGIDLDQMFIHGSTREVPRLKTADELEEDAYKQTYMKPVGHSESGPITNRYAYGYIGGIGPESQPNTVMFRVKGRPDIFNPMEPEDMARIEAELQRHFRRVEPGQDDDYYKSMAKSRAAHLAERHFSTLESHTDQLRNAGFRGYIAKENYNIYDPPYGKPDTNKPVDYIAQDTPDLALFDPEDFELYFDPKDANKYPSTHKPTELDDLYREQLYAKKHGVENNAQTAYEKLISGIPTQALDKNVMDVYPISHQEYQYVNQVLKEIGKVENLKPWGELQKVMEDPKAHAAYIKGLDSSAELQTLLQKAIDVDDPGLAAQVYEQALKKGGHYPSSVQEHVYNAMYPGGLTQNFNKFDPTDYKTSSALVDLEAVAEQAEKLGITVKGDKVAPWHKIQSIMQKIKTGTQIKYASGTPIEGAPAVKYMGAKDTPISEMESDKYQAAVTIAKKYNMGSSLFSSGKVTVSELGQGMVNSITKTNMTKAEKAAAIDETMDALDLMHKPKDTTFEGGKTFEEPILPGEDLDTFTDADQTLLDELLSPFSESKNPLAAPDYKPKDPSANPYWNAILAGHKKAWQMKKQNMAGELSTEDMDTELGKMFEAGDWEPKMITPFKIKNAYGFNVSLLDLDEEVLSVAQNKLLDLETQFDLPSGLTAHVPDNTPVEEVLEPYALELSKLWKMADAAEDAKAANEIEAAIMSLNDLFDGFSVQFSAP